MSGKYSPGMLVMRQKLLDHAKKSATDAFKTASKRVIQKSAESTGELIDGNKIANLIKSQKFQNIHNKIIQRWLQMRIIKNYLKKDIYL